MINGHVDLSGRASVKIEISASAADADPSSLEAWIDTGFTGDLVLPQTSINQLALPESSSVSAVLADGSEVLLKTFTCFLRWFGENRELEIVANEGDQILLGVALLLDHVLEVDYQVGTLSIR
jgi:clan AA aspartic protease